MKLRSKSEVGRARLDEAAADLAIRTVDDGYASLSHELCGVQAWPDQRRCGRRKISRDAPLLNQTLQPRLGTKLVFRFANTYNEMDLSARDPRGCRHPRYGCHYSLWQAGRQFRPH